MSHPEKSRGQTAYEAYADAVAWLGPDGPLNAWATLPVDVRAVWNALAHGSRVKLVRAEYAVYVEDRA